MTDSINFEFKTKFDYLSSLVSDKTILITTKGIDYETFPDNDSGRNTLLKAIQKNKEAFYKILEAEESVSENGHVLIELKENKINELLREIFSIKPGSILIALNNSQYNPVHEKGLSNLLKVAGYQSVLISSESENFISFLSRMFVK